MSPRLRQAFFVASLTLLGSPAQAWTQLNATPIQVIQIAPRNAGFTTPTQQYMIIGFNASFIFCGQTQNYVAVPKANPDTTVGGDNPAYQDYVNIFMLALRLGSGVGVYLHADGCIDGLPRLVGATLDATSWRG